MDLRHLPEGTHSLAPRPGSLARLAFHKWSAWGDLHSQGCSGLSRTGLLFPGPEKLPSALNLASDHYFDGARSLPAH